MDSSIPFLLFSVLLVTLTRCSENIKENNLRVETEGEFTSRMVMATERLTTPRYRPEFTRNFILADVNISRDNPRRFDNYSGDLSGRYIEALTGCCYDSGCVFLDTIVYEVLKYQHTDGRFGDKSLVFKESQIGKEHMPLLWGNGRMLVGLLEYYGKSNDPKVLDAAKKQGDFFAAIYSQVTPVVSRKLEGLGADGIICFTQYAEPLVRLSAVTGDSSYAGIASQVYKLLPGRGILHSHGYLTTLRGVLELYEFDRNVTHFEFVKNAYDELVESDDFTLYGSVREYFGIKGERDEGCATADFIRLSLHLYRLTRNLQYLERAEFAMYNALYFNQFITGDFGHHTFDGISSHSNTFNAAWWCCTMAGLRAMQIIKRDGFIESRNDTIRVNLFLDTDYSDNEIAFSASRGTPHGEFHSYEISLQRMVPGKTLFIREPSWVSETEIYVNGKPAACTGNTGGLTLNSLPAAGDEIEIRMKYQMQLLVPGKSAVPLRDLEKSTTGALCYGPLIMAIDNNMDFTFLSEPNNNSIYASTIATAYDNENVRQVTSGSFSGDLYLTACYKHDGFPSYYQTVLRPVSEMTFARHPYMMAMMRFVPESEEGEMQPDKTILVPWEKHQD
jgi:hypothetical protein